MARVALIHALPCKECGTEFLWCWKRGRDFRCDKCRGGMTAAEVEKELSEMSKEEYDSFMKDIEEYEKEHGN